MTRLVVCEQLAQSHYVKANQSKVKPVTAHVIIAPSQKSRHQCTYKISALTNIVTDSQSSTKSYCTNQTDSPILDCAKNPDAYWHPAMSVDIYIM